MSDSLKDRQKKLVNVMKNSLIDSDDWQLIASTLERSVEVRAYFNLKTKKVMLNVKIDHLDEDIMMGPVDRLALETLQNVLRDVIEAKGRYNYLTEEKS